jgi:hypothetical protein
VLTAFALFEGIAHLRRGGAADPPICVPRRLVGFAVALVLMVVKPMASGNQTKIF